MYSGYTPLCQTDQRLSANFRPDCLTTREKHWGVLSLFGVNASIVRVPILHKIKVQEMEVFPPASTLPSLRDLYGIAPNATGDMTTEQFVRQLRDEWD